MTAGMGVTPFLETCDWLMLLATAIKEVNAGHTYTAPGDQPFVLVKAHRATLQRFFYPASRRYKVE